MERQVWLCCPKELQGRWVWLEICIYTGLKDKALLLDTLSIRPRLAAMPPGSLAMHSTTRRSSWPFYWTDCTRISTSSGRSHMWTCLS